MTGVVTRVLCLLSVLGGLIFACPENFLLAQQSIANMPEGWQNLSADEFGNAVSAYFQFEAAQQTATPIVRHAWDSFLANDQISSPLNSATRRKLILAVQPRLAWLTQDEGPETPQAQLAVLTARVDSLAGAALAELEQVLQANGSLAWKDLNAWRWSIANGAGGAERRVQWERLALSWKNQNDIRTLDVRDLWALKEDLERDLINRQAFSVRWTGFLTAPVTGEYQLYQLRSAFGTGQMKVWVGDRLVLNTTKASAAGTRFARPYQSQPVALTAQQPVALKVEYIYDEAIVAVHLPRSGDQVLFPFAVLNWSQGEGTPVLIPKEAYSPPQGFSPGSLTGLKGEFFSDTKLTNSVQTRLDPGVGFLWPRIRRNWVRSIAPSQHQAKEDVVAEGLRRSLHVENDPAVLITEDFRKLLIRRVPRELNAWEGLDLLDRFSRSPAVLANQSAEEMLWAWEALGILPGETRVRLLSNWGQALPPLTAKVFPAPRDYAWFYTNHSSYQIIGRWLRSPDNADLDNLIENHLTNEDGSCRLQTLLIVAHALLEEDQHQRVRDIVNSHLANAPDRSDVTASWHIARAWTEEAISGAQPRLTEALPHLDEAFLAATTDAMKFRTLQEIYPRLIGLGRSTEAIEQIDASRNHYVEPAQQQALHELRVQAEQMGPQLAAWEQSRGQNRANLRSKQYRDSMQARIEKALARGDAAAAQQYQAQLDALEQ